MHSLGPTNTINTTASYRRTDVDLNDRRAHQVSGRLSHGQCLRAVLRFHRTVAEQGTNYQGSARLQLQTSAQSPYGLRGKERVPQPRIRD